MALRADLVFSYWIFVWYLLYMADIIGYSPKIVIGLGIIENGIMLLFMFLFGSTFENIAKFLIINTFIKLIPYYTLIHETFRLKDAYFGLLLFAVYSLYVYMNGKSVIEYQNKIYDSLIHNKNDTPFMYLVTKIWSK